MLAHGRLQVHGHLRMGIAYLLHQLRDVLARMLARAKEQGQHGDVRGAGLDQPARGGGQVGRAGLQVGAGGQGLGMRLLNGLQHGLDVHVRAERGGDRVELLRLGCDLLAKLHEF